MKESTFLARTKNVNKGSKGYQLALSLMTGNPYHSWETRIRTCWTSGTGRFCKNLDYTEDTIAVLRFAGLRNGIDFELKNDAPRGGLTGNYIELTSKGKRKMIETK
jgi:hypothetical protein